MNRRIPESELIINPNGSIYHLNLKPGQIARDIIIVGDPDRVHKVSQHFDRIDLEVSKREFKTVTGWIGSKRLTVLSTGIGTDNIDIVFTELDALANIDFESRTKKETHTSLNFYRIGTSGSLSATLEVNATLISTMAIGLDGLMHFYKLENSKLEMMVTAQAKKVLDKIPGIVPYVTTASPTLVHKFLSLGVQGITITASGFYGPQGRAVIAAPKSDSFLDDLAKVEVEGLKVTNFEMETAGIYGMAKILGHEALSINAIIANRIHKTFSKKPKEVVAKLIEDVLKLICN
jgi:uridine phosphorylase